MTNPAKTTAYALLALVAFAGVLFVALYGMTNDAQRPELIELVRPVITGAVAGVPAIVAAAFGIQTHRQTRDVGEGLEVVKRQTNGELRRAMAEIVGGQLDARGLVPRQRATDTGPATQDHIYTYPEGGTE